MKTFFLILTLTFSGISSAQVSDLKTKTAENNADRSAILDLARKEILKDLKQDILFKVNHLKVSKGYAWFEGTPSRKDGKPMEFPGEGYDCCHAEGLFQKKNGKWQIVEFGHFSTDCWYCGLAGKYPKVPKAIFTEAPLISE